MSPIISGAVAATIAYFVGALPFGYLTAWYVAKIDIRAHGSGNIGATNVARTLGAKWGAFVLAMDALKGFLPVLLLPRLFFGWDAVDEVAFRHTEVVCGIATVVGHMFPIYLKLRGGKGVATSLGVILVISTWPTLIAIGVYLCCILLIRIASVASMLAAVSFPIAFLLMVPDPLATKEWSRTVFSLVIPTLIILRHYSNLMRIYRGQEPQFHFGGAESNGRNGTVIDVAKTNGESGEHASGNGQAAEPAEAETPHPEEQQPLA